MRLHCIGSRIITDHRLLKEKAGNRKEKNYGFNIALREQPDVLGYIRDFVLHQRVSL